MLTVNLPRTLLLLVAFGLPLWLGCGGIKTYDVDGQVVYENGSPATDLAGYGVTFVCGDQDPPATGVGVVDAQGKFAISTFDDEDGAVAGRHRVALTPPIPYGDEPMTAATIDAKYHDVETSELTVDVPNGDVVLQIAK